MMTMKQHLNIKVRPQPRKADLNLRFNLQIARLYI